MINDIAKLISLILKEHFNYSFINIYYTPTSWSKIKPTTLTSMTFMLLMVNSITSLLQNSQTKESPISLINIISSPKNFRELLSSSM